jgi:hypothetical protein
VSAKSTENSRNGYGVEECIDADPVSGNQAASGDRSLAELGGIVEQGKRTFLEVGAALSEIRERELYKPKAWTEYLRERFGFSRQHAHRLIRAKEFADASPMGDKPVTDREARKRISEQRAKTPNGNEVTVGSEVLKQMNPKD